MKPRNTRKCQSLHARWPFGPVVIQFVLPRAAVLLTAVVFLAADLVTSQDKQATGVSEAPAADQTGPQTEKRFPPMTVPEGFKVTLFACDPLVEYPSVIAIGPQPGTLFVVHDYMTGLGVEIVRRDEVRLLRDSDADGYADESVVYATGFNSIQGMAYHAGSVYVMHAPLLTSLRDADGDGVAELRKDLLSGLGLAPEDNPNRLHCANGVVAGHDGWLYLALGDRGCDVVRPEGDRLVFQQGGILRCRTDGRDLHVLSHGLRNIYDVALDEELNVFVRDNENDGGDYMIRVCHCFHGSDHGYPYLYYERPTEAMPPLADLGRGSSAGGTSYLEVAFPGEYRESLYFCEWGRAVVRYHQQRAGSSFVSNHEVDFAAGAATDPYGFKPTDVVVDYDGSLLISDWGDGQRPKRGRGRIYRIQHLSASRKAVGQVTVSGDSDFETLVAALDSKSSIERISAQEEIERRGSDGALKIQQAIQSGDLKSRGRMHAIWILAHVRGEDSLEDLFRLAETDPDPRVRAQAVRAVADLTDPVLAEHKLSAVHADPGVIARLARLVKINQDSRLALEVIVALGRLQWSGAPGWLRDNLGTLKPDPALEHAATQMLRRAQNWEAVLLLLDEADPEAAQGAGLHRLALRAVANEASETVVDGLIARLKNEADPRRRGEYVDMLSRVYKKPAAWTYWGFRPAPRPANPVSWERTPAIQQALSQALVDADPDVRMLALKQMRREHVPVLLESLAAWLSTEKETQRVAMLLESLSDFTPLEVRPLLEGVLQDKLHADANRLTALAAWSGGLKPGDEPHLLRVAQALDEGQVLAALLRDLGTRDQVKSDLLLLGKLDSTVAVVRSAAIDSLATRKNRDAASHVVRLLDDPELVVRRSAASAAGHLQVAAAVELLRTLVLSDDRELSRLSLVSLKELQDPKAVSQAIGALQHEATQLAAISYLEEFGDAGQLELLTKLAESNRSIDLVTGVVRAVARWQSRNKQDSDAGRALAHALAVTQVKSETLLHWWMLDPATTEEVSRLVQELATENEAESLPLPSSIPPIEWVSRIAEGTDSVVPVHLDPGNPAGLGSDRLAVSDLFMEQAGNVEFLGSCDRAWRIWLNGRELFHRDKPAPYLPNSDRFDAVLEKGINRLVVEIDKTAANTQFHLRFRLKSSKAEHERLIQLGLSGQGSATRGREVFLNAEKSQCVKCHRLAEQQAGRIGPDLTGIGSRFSRIHLIESILEPSRTVAPSYATVVLALEDGQVLSGVRIAETEATLTLGDNKGKVHTIKRSEIDQLKVQLQSTMPEGLEKRLTDREFVDLLIFLISQKKN